MIELKPISKEAIHGALAKAERYRLLNEPRQAESICRDVLRTHHENQEGLVILLLALTDQFGKESGVHLDHPRELLPQLGDEYRRAYYTGVIFERWAMAQMGQGTPQYVGFDWLREAMSWYEKAEAIRPTGNDDAILRWNTCARILQREKHGETEKTKQTGPKFEGGFDDEVPVI